ncbi:MAG: hypothetical protein K1X64_06590 [Myxococcaceae bacterium]|nr:hypothetical protein [Myxococcaceae bacterium]
MRLALASPVGGARGDSGAHEARRLSALLRRRTRWLLATLPKRHAEALSFLPALLHATFPRRELKSDAPGIEGQKAGKKWGALARAFDLPTASGMQRGRRVIAALFAAPREGGFDAWVCWAGDLGQRERERAMARLEAAEALLTQAGVSTRVTPWPNAPSRVDWARVLCFGAVVAGRLPASFWAAARRAGESPDDTPPLAGLWQWAPTELTRALLLPFAARGVPAPFQALLDALNLAAIEGRAALSIADPELFCAVWLSPGLPRPRLAFELLATLSASTATQAWAGRLLASPGNRRVLSTVPLELEITSDVENVLRLARELTLLALREARRVPRAVLGPLRRYLHRAWLGVGVPTFFLPALEKALKPQLKTGPEPLQVVTQGNTVEVREVQGAVLGRGRTVEQAWGRALFLVAQTLGAAVAQSVAPEEWRPLLRRFGQPLERRTLLLAVGRREAVGPPYDPLNRGKDRSLALTEALVVTLTPGSRPAASRLGPTPTVEKVALEAMRGTMIDVALAVPGAQPAVARLARLARFCRPGAQELPLAIEAGGRVLWWLDGDHRWSSVGAFTARPRRYALDPEAPDFGGVVTAKRWALNNPNNVECLAWLREDNWACLLYTDSQGWRLREDVPVRWLERHLAGAQALLHEGFQPRLLSVRATPDLVTAVERAAGEAPEEIGVSVYGRLPFGLTVELFGERFGAHLPLGWSAAAQSILARWPDGLTGYLRVDKVAVDVRVSSDSLATLYARSVAVRRLWAHVRLVSGT